MVPIPSTPSDIATAIDLHPPDVAGRLHDLRALIYDVAATTAGCGTITESLKWGQPSFEAIRPRSGTPLRVGLAKTGEVALYAHCQTTVITQARDIFSGVLAFEANRAVLLPVRGDWPDGPLRQVIRSALIYRIKSAGGGR
jgi:hypothetical protein